MGRKKRSYRPRWSVNEVVADRGDQLSSFPYFAGPLGWGRISIVVVFDGQGIHDVTGGRHGPVLPFLIGP